MESRLTTHATSDPSPASPHLPAPDKQQTRGARGIGARLRPTRSTELTQQLAVLSMGPEARSHGGHHVPCPDRPECEWCTYSGTSQRKGKGKAHTDAERSTRATPNAVTQSRSHESTAPSRRTTSNPFTFPSRLPMTRPVSPSHPSSPDFLTPIASSRTSTSMAALGLDTFSSSFCAATIAACAAAADSTIQPTTKPQLFNALSHSPSPTYISSSCHQRYNTIPHHLPSHVQPWDVSSSTVSADRLDAPLPPIERPTHHPASLTPGLSPSRTHVSTSFTLPARFSVEGVSARLSPAIITRQPQYPILSLPPISPTSIPTNDSRRLRSRSLRTVPALPMEGPEDLEPAEHDNAMLDELDEEEDGVIDGEEDAEEETAEVEQPESASEDGESASRPPSSENSRLGTLPTIDTSRLHLSFLDVNTRETNQSDNTPKTLPIGDYFTSKRTDPTSHTPSLNPRPFPATWSSARTTPALPTSTPPGVLAAAWATSAQRVLPTPTTPAMNGRASIYHQASRSMSDFSAILRRPPHRTPEVASKTPKSSPRDPLNATAVDTEEPDAQLEPSLKRRLSMPTFGPSSEPPPYPEFRFGVDGPTIQPRDEEGREPLPQYTNDIYLRAVMPRKMEFSAPGVQARDRKWRRTLCILEGTAFRVYKCRPTASGKGLIGNLWEKTVGVGDIAASSNNEASASSAKPKRESEREREPRIKSDTADGAPPQSPMSSPTSSQPPIPSPNMTPTASSSLQSHNGLGGTSSSSSSARSRLLPSNFRRKHRASHDGALTPGTSEFGTPTTSSFTPSSSRHMGLDSRSSSDNGAPQARSASRPNPNVPSYGLVLGDGLTSPSLPIGSPPQRVNRAPRTKRRHLWVDDPTVPHPQEQDLLHVYSLHNAESGLATDYLKRKNVIRVRMEGEQFLLQARDAAGVVDWVEGFQAAANIAQDLDDRPMPKGPLFPRRRRRRARIQQAEPALNSLTDA